MRHSEASEIEANAWKGRVQERIKLVQKGYQSLAIIVGYPAFSHHQLNPSFNCRQCTFLAGVQASILSMTATQTDVTAQIVNGFFFAGLVADIGAAILSAASQRWFEMIRRDEAEHVYDYLKEAQSDTRSEDAVEEQTNSSSSQIKNVAGKEKGEEEHVDVTVVPSATSTVSKRYYGIELWLFFALKAPPYAAVLGFAFMVAGVMLWVWAHEAVVAKVLCTVLCVLLVILLPPFAIHHDRKEALKRFKLKRVSG